MSEELSATLLRLSEEIEAASQPAPAAEVRRRSGQRRSRAAVGAAALSVAAAAVAVPVALGSGQPGGTDPTPPAGPSVGTGGAASTPPPSSEPVPSPEPSLGWDTSIQRTDEDLGSHVAGCMVGNGFAALDFMPKPVPAAADEAAEFGFSISTRLEGDTGESVSLDPVAEARKVLPTSRRAEFDEAIDRCWARAAELEPPVRLPADRAVVVPSPHGSGAFTIMMVQEDDADLDYEESVRALVQADPRLIAANERWAGCMREAGYEATSPDGLRIEIEGRTRPYRDAYEAGLPVPERGNDGPNSKSLEEVLTPEQLDRLAEVQRYERAAAVASGGCDDELNLLLPVVWQNKLDEYFGYTG